MTAALLRAESGAEPQLARLLEGGYEGLRPCLAEEGRGTEGKDGTEEAP
jgi:hypothetical protein